jgi:hypothetical protein
MTAVAVSWNGTKAVAADGTGTWNTGAYNTDIHIENTQCRGKLMKASSGADRMFDLAATGGPYDFTGAHSGHHIFVWVGAMTAVDAIAAGGLRIVIADDKATDSVGEWYVGKGTGYLNGWRNYVINPALAFDNLVAGGSAPAWTAGGNPAQLTGVDGFGGGFLPLTSPSGNSPNMFVDACSVGVGYILTGGDSTDPDGKFTDLTDFEDKITASANVNKYGGIRIASGIIFAKSKIYIGGSGSENTDFTDSGFVVVWEDGRVSSTFYEFILRKGTGATNVVLSNGLLAAASPQTFKATLSGTTATTITNLTVDRASAILMDSAVVWNGGTVKNSGLVTVNGATFAGVDVRGSTNDPALNWNTAETPSTKLSGTKFTSNGTQHAIEFGTNTPGNTYPSETNQIALTNVSFFSYSGTPGDNLSDGGDAGAAIYNNSGKYLVLNINGGTIPAVFNATGCKTKVVSGQRTLQLTGLQNGSDISIRTSGTNTELVDAQENSGSTYDYIYAYSAGTYIDILVMKAGYVPYMVYNYLLQDGNATLPIAQVVDRAYG